MDDPELDRLMMQAAAVRQARRACRSTTARCRTAGRGSRRTATCGARTGTCLANVHGIPVPPGRHRVLRDAYVVE
ncbi:hypothetical protein HBB16_07440 [Pseudonocardia sp. MCCB 268]|nr:hypothetical protein [Pseudonocardia cytotoxica]